MGEGHGQYVGRCSIHLLTRAKYSFKVKLEWSVLCSVGTVFCAGLFSVICGRKSGNRLHKGLEVRHGK